jgi:flagellar biosynthesis/type III secretory pathway protein FliH
VVVHICNPNTQEVELKASLAHIARPYHTHTHPKTRKEEGRKEGRTEGRKEGRKEGSQASWCCSG